MSNSAMGYLRLTFTDEQVEDVPIGMQDAVRFERKYKVGSGTLPNAGRVEWLLYVAWCSLQRHGKTPGDFEAFIGTVRLVEWSDGPDEADGPLDRSPESPGDEPSPE